MKVNEIIDLLIKLEDEELSGVKFNLKIVFEEESPFKDMKLSSGTNGRNITELFMELPDKELYPDYYETINEPIALNQIKKKGHRNVQDLQKDIDLLVSNACEYNDPGSQIYEDALTIKEKFYSAIGKPIKKIWKERKHLTKLTVNKLTIKIGDFVYVKNESDPGKSLIAQVFDIWSENTDTNKTGITACWYVRPEYTVHRSTQKFYPNEVFKTSSMHQYFSTDIEGICSVLFIKDYIRGKPKNIPSKDVYICESRYVEPTKIYTKIKNWSSCVPESVRGKQVDLDLFDEPLQLVRTVPSIYAESLSANTPTSTKKRKASEDLKESTMKKMALETTKPQTESEKPTSTRPKRLSSGGTPTLPIVTDSSMSHSPKNTIPASTPTPTPTPTTTKPIPPLPTPQSQITMKNTNTKSEPKESLSQPKKSTQQSPINVVPDSIVSAFDIDDRLQLKWFATPPIQVFEKQPPVHSLSYLKWKAIQTQKKKSETSFLASQDHNKQNESTLNNQVADGMGNQDRREFISFLDEETLGCSIVNPATFIFKELKRQFKKDAQNLTSSFQE